MSCYLCHSIPALCLNSTKGNRSLPCVAEICELSGCPQVVAVSPGSWVPELVSILPFHACVALCAVPALGCNHQGSDSSVWESCGLMGWCNLTPNTKWNNSWFIVWRLWDPGLLRRALRCLRSPGRCSVAKLKEKFLLGRSSYKTLAVQELLRHAVTSCWISHLKSPTSLERCAVGLPLYHAYKETT